MSQHLVSSQPDGYAPSPYVQEALDRCAEILESQRATIAAFAEITRFLCGEDVPPSEEIDDAGR